MQLSPNFMCLFIHSDMHVCVMMFVDVGIIIFTYMIHDHTTTLISFFNSYCENRYCISVSFTMFNKWVLSDYRGGFHFSTIYTTIHMFIQLALSRLWYRFCYDEVIEPVSWPIILKTVMPIGVATAVDIMLSNMALMYVTLTLYTIIKSSVLIWTFFWGVMLGECLYAIITSYMVFVIWLCCDFSFCSNYFTT